MTEEERDEQQWRRIDLARAVRLIGSWYHSGQWSKGYRKSCQGDRILDMLGYRPGAYTDDSTDPEIRAIAAEYLWKHRRTIARTW